MAPQNAAASPAPMVGEIARAELLSRLSDPSLTIVDARYGTLYREEHLPRAINIPMTEVEALAPTLLLDRTADIAVYCASFT